MRYSTVFYVQERFMEAAIQEAQKAKELGDYAIGAVLTYGDQIVMRAPNRVKIDQDPTAHAEIVAIRNATQRRNSRHLEYHVLWTTHEPCPMCTSAAIFARIAGIVYGATLEDMKEYGKKNGNQYWSWRTIDIPAKTIIELHNQSLADKIFTEETMLIKGEFMREKCRELFHN